MSDTCNEGADPPNPAQAATFLVNRASRGTVRLWTIQPLWVWERLRRERALWSDPTGEAFFQDFRDSYDWMCGQMRERLPDYQGHYPWWAYEHRPDLRGHVTGDDGPHVRMELALPPERVLLSAYGDWHWVLNLWYLPPSVAVEEAEREADAWEAELARHGLSPHKDRPLPEPWESRVEKSWGRIFDVDVLRETNTIQACFERLELADVVRVTVFAPRARPEWAVPSRAKAPLSMG